MRHDGGPFRLECRAAMASTPEAKRLALVAGYSVPLVERPRTGPSATSRRTTGQVVQIDCFYVGRLSGTQGCHVAIHGHRRGHVLWMGRAASRPGQAPELTVDLTTDHGSEFQGDFGSTLEDSTLITTASWPGCPQSKGSVEPLHEAILEECWKPAFARHCLPGLTGLREELHRYRRDDNTDRAHTGRLAKARTPEEVLGSTTRVLTRHHRWPSGWSIPGGRAGTCTSRPPAPRGEPGRKLVLHTWATRPEAMRSTRMYRFREGNVAYACT